MHVERQTFLYKCTKVIIILSIWLHEGGWVLYVMRHTPCFEDEDTFNLQVTPKLHICMYVCMYVYMQSPNQFGGSSCHGFIVVLVHVMYCFHEILGNPELCYK
jgi:hypothetical protein